MTEENLEAIGDVTAITTSLEPNAHVQAEALMAVIKWEGYGISDGDELYHTTWENVEGELNLSLPVPARFLRLNPEIHEISKHGFHSRPTWVFEFEADAAADLQKVAGLDCTPAQRS